jgi:hypothetical protein
MDPKQNATVKVDIKKFSRFLYSHVVQPSDVICCMSFSSLRVFLYTSPRPFTILTLCVLVFVQDRVLVLLVVCKDELHITYYLPVILS